MRLRLKNSVQRRGGARELRRLLDGYRRLRDRRRGVSVSDARFVVLLTPVREGDIDARGTPVGPAMATGHWHRGTIRFIRRSEGRPGKAV